MRSLNTFRRWHSYRRLLPGVLAIFGATCGPVAGAANGRPKPVSQYLRDGWASEKGFPGGLINAITQTPDGYLWVGAQNGLFRFDGRNFRLFSQTGTNSHPIGAVLGLLNDGGGNLWVRLEGHALLRYRDGEFEDFTNRFDIPEVAVTQMCLAADGHAIFATLLNGVIAYDHGKFTTVARPPDLPNFIVTSIALAPDGAYWLGTRDLGLFQIRDGKISARHDVLTERQINVLLYAGRRQLWIGTDKGLLLWDGAELTEIGPDSPLHYRQILSLASDRDGNIWVGTDHGLVRLDRESNFLPKAENTEGKGPVSAIFEDREGNIWSGSPNGLQRLRNTSFTSYAIAGESNGPVHVDPDGRTWFAPIEGGLYWLKDTRVGTIHEAGLDKDIVYSIAGGNGDLWVARQRGGLTHLQNIAGKWEGLTYTRKDGLAQDSVYTVRLSRDGTVWAGTLSAGLTRIKDGRFSTVTTEDGLISNTIASILESRDGTMWFATPRGLSSFANNHWVSYSSTAGLPSDDISCLFEDSAGILWIGTMNGLATLRAGRIGVPPQQPAPLREPIFGLQEDANGFMWISTSNHILMISRERLLQPDFNAADIREFGLADGLRDTDGVKRDEAVASGTSGEIWFSLHRGLSVVDTKRLRIGSPPSILHLEGLSVDGNPVSFQNPLRISPNPQRITIDYAGISLSVPDRVRFKCKLDGFDPAWSDPLVARQASYTNLNPGSYLFRVTASNSDGLWNGAELTLPFTIEPVFWRTWWFRLAALCTLVLSALTIIRLRVLVMTRQLNVLFEERLAERTRIARELHDTLLQSVQGLILRFHAVAKQMPSQEPARQALEEALDRADQVIGEGRERVRNLRDSAASLSDLPSAFQRVVEESPQGSAATFKAVVEGSARELHPMVLEESFSIGREALVNALTHSGGLHIEVEITYDPHHLRLRVRDDGRGIDPSILESGGRADHWGLQGMRERANRIGAQLELWSRPGSGTEVALVVPGATAYRSKRERAKTLWLRKPFGIDS